MSLRAVRTFLQSHVALSTVLGVSVLLGGVMFLLAGSQLPASAADVNHQSVVPESPRRDTPVALDGFVFSTVQIGDRVIVAGDFSQVETTRGGPIVARSNIFAYDINSGAIIDDFAPVVNGIIYDLVVDEDTGSLYLGGSFTQIDGTWRLRVGKLDYFGDLDPAFVARASAVVQALEVSNEVLYLGGSFATVNDEPHERIAAVDAGTGVSIPNFNYGIVGNLGKAETRSVKALDMTSDGQRLLVVFNGQSIVDNNGVLHDRFGVGFINVDLGGVTAYRTRWFENAYPRCSQGSLQLRDAELSPDDSMFVIVEKGNWRCDKIVAFPGATGGATSVDPLWVTAAHDSVFSVGVTNNAVYAGGHFCFVTAHGPISADDAATYPWVNKPQPCDITDGNETIGDFVARQQIVALNPANGEPLDWNPKSNAQEAVFDIEPIDRGLLVGQDADRINNIRTGLHAFLDFGGSTPPFQPPAPPACNATVDANMTVSLAWDEAVGVDSYVVRRNGSWLTNTNLTTFGESPAAGSYDYVIRYRVGNVTTDLACNPTIQVSAPGLSCNAAVNSDSVSLSWTAQPGADSYQVRKNGRWAASTPGTAYTEDGLAAGTYTYEIRFRAGGVTTTESCTPTPVEIAGQSFACERNAGTLTWNAVTGVDSYQVRKNGKWLASTGLLSFTDVNAAAADTYEIRYRQGGTTTVGCT